MWIGKVEQPVGIHLGTEMSQVFLEEKQKQKNGRGKTEGLDWIWKANDEIMGMLWKLEMVCSDIFGGYYYHKYQNSQ